MWCHFTRRTKAELVHVLMTLNFLRLTMAYIRNSRWCILSPVVSLVWSVNSTKEMFLFVSEEYLYLKLRDLIQIVFHNDIIMQNTCLEASKLLRCKSSTFLPSGSEPVFTFPVVCSMHILYFDYKLKKNLACNRNMYTRKQY